MQSLELELQDKKNKLISSNEQLEQASRSLKSCTGGQAKLEGDASTCNQQLLEKRHQLDGVRKEVEKLSTALHENEASTQEQVERLTSASNTCKADLERVESDFTKVSQHLKQAEKQQLDINKTYESEVHKLTKNFEGQVSDQRQRIQEIGKDRKDKVVKLAGQLTALRSQLDELVDHIESEHKEINEIHNFGEE